jgi:transposase InsO family protein
VINKTKAHFARYGSPSVLVSDNGPQYVSESFERFAKVWDFEHRTISPRYSKSNGKVESAVKTAKRFLRKSMDAKICFSIIYDFTFPHLLLAGFRPRLHYTGLLFIPD